MAEEVDKPIGDTQVLEDPRRALVDRVAASESFKRSPRLRKLLIHLAECALREDQSPLTEQQVGVAVFDRPAGYDTSADTVVRVQASEIRKRLKYYFLAEGLQEPIVMELPRGSYLPVFITRERIGSSASDENHVVNGRIKTLETEESPQRLQLPEEVPAPAIPAKPHSQMVMLSLLGLAIILCCWLTYQNIQLRRSTAPETPYLRHFWTQFFQNGRQTEVVPGDSGLVVFADILGRNISLKEYSNPAYPKPILDPMVADQKNNYYISKVATRGVLAPYDATAIHDLSLLSERYQIPFDVVATREARVDSDLPDNLILLGHERTNPWLELFEGRMNFRHRYDDSTRKGTILNTSPLPNEKPSYVLENRQNSYAIVACMPGTAGKGSVLILVGGYLSSVDGAVHLVTDESAMARLHELLGVGLSDRIPYFEVLLEKAPSAQNYEIIAHRIIKNQ